MIESDLHMKAYLEGAIFLAEKAGEVAREGRISEFTSTSAECRIDSAVHELRMLVEGLE